MLENDLEILLKDYYPFDLLDEEELFQLTDKATQTTFSKNEFLFHEDESIEDIDIYFLVSGLAKNILHQSNGKQLSLRYYYPGELIGLMVMFTSGELNFSVQALENCSVFKFNKSHFFEMMMKNTKFSRVIWESVGHTTKSLYDEMKNKPANEDDENISLLKTRVKNLSDPPIFINPDELMFTAAQKMKDLHALGMIVSEDSINVEGILTPNEIYSYVTDYKHSHRVKDWKSELTDYVGQNSFAYEALSLIKSKDLNFLPVVHDKRVIGTLSPKSFLNLNDSNYLDLLVKITNSTSFDQLNRQGPTENRIFHSFISDLIANDSYAYVVSEINTKHNDTLHQQIIKLTENELKVEGFGPPPINYCFIVMGSQARHEQGFYTDQDNGMILSDYQHLPNKDKIDHYFATFTSRINKRLAEVGFSECTGGIMAKELKWRKSISEWKVEIEKWKKQLDAEEIQSFTMFYDFRPVFGDFSLADEIREFLIQKANKSKILQHFLMKDAIRFKVPMQPLGLMNIKQKNKRINIKKVGLMQIIYCIRINAIKYGISEVSTIKRLDALKKMNAMHPRDVENAKTALHYLLYYRLTHNLKELENGEPFTNEIPVNHLTKDDRLKLKEAIPDRKQNAAGHKD